MSNETKIRIITFCNLSEKEHLDLTNYIAFKLFDKLVSDEIDYRGKNHESHA